MTSEPIPLFKADWLRVMFMHFRVAPKALQPLVPFELDRFGGDAYVSLVAFTQARLRPAGMGRIGEMLSAPLAHHEFLNLRTYVRHEGQAGIYFLTEWIPNRLAALIGPRIYGLPYRLGRLRYRWDATVGRVAGGVVAGRRRLIYRGSFDLHAAAQPAAPGSLDDFLIERYVAFTHQGDVARSFHVSHASWPIKPVCVELLQTSLIAGWRPLSNHTHPIAAQVSVGVSDVLISAPRRLPRLSLLRRSCDATTL